MMPRSNVKPGIGACRFEGRPHEHAGRRERHERQRELAHHEQVARRQRIGEAIAPAPPPSRRPDPSAPAPRPFARDATRGRARRAPRSQAEERPSPPSTRTSGVVSNCTFTGRRLRERRAEQPRRPPGDERRDRAADEREHDAFGQELPHDAKAAAADRESNRELLPARAAAREEHVGEIEATRRAARGRTSRTAASPASPQLAVGLRARADRQPRERRHQERLILVLAREGLLELRAGGLERRRDGRDRRARTGARDEDERVMPAIGQRAPAGRRA